MIKKILSQTAVQIAGKLFTAALSLIVIKYITSLEPMPGLSGIPAEYKLVYTYLLFFGILADFGLFTIGVREMSREPEEKTPYILGNILGMRICTSIIAMIIASAVVFLIPAENYSNQVKIGVSLAAIATIFTMLASTISSVLQVHLKMTIPTIALMIGKTISTIYIVLVILNYQDIKGGFYHLLMAGIIGALVTYLITHWYTSTLFPCKPLFDLKYWKLIFQKAAPYGIAVILSTLYFKIDILILSFFRGSQEIAIYGYPATMIEMLTIFAFYFINAILPSLSKAVKENTQKASIIIKHSATFLMAMAAPITIGGFILAKPITRLTMNEAFLTPNTEVYYGADVAFQLMMISFLFGYLTILFSHTLVAHDEQTKLLKINAIGVIINVIMNLIFIPYFGFLAAGCTTIASQALMLWLNYRHCKKLTVIQWDYPAMAKIMIAAVSMGLIVYVLQEMTNLLIIISIGALVFGILIWKLKVIDLDMLKLMEKATPPHYNATPLETGNTP